MGISSSDLPYELKQRLGMLPPDKKPRAERGKGKVGTRKRERCAAMNEPATVFKSPGEVSVYIVAAALGKPTMSHGDKWKKRPCVMAYRAWCDQLRAEFPNRPEAGDIDEVRIVAQYAMPADWSKRKQLRMAGQHKRTKPDGDNIAKAICDALWPNDQQLGDIVVRRRWGLADLTIINVKLRASASPAVDGDAAGAGVK